MTDDSLVAAASAVAPWLPADSVRELDGLLSSGAADRPLEERTEAVVGIARWLGLVGREREEAVGARLSALIQMLERVPSARARISSLVASVVSHANAVPLFSETGLSTDHRFLSQALDRLAHKLIPSAPDDGDLSELLGRILPTPRAGDRLGAQPPALLAAVATHLGDDTWAPVRAAMTDALVVLGVRVSALGLDRELRRRGADGPLESSPFVRLLRACETLAAALRSKARTSACEKARAECLEAVAQCRDVARRVRAHLEEFGVSVDLVYRLELIDRHLARIETMAGLLVPADGANMATAARDLVAELARQRAQSHSLSALARGNLQLLSRKIIERAGATGEHYITSTRAEYKHMLGSAAGGGALTTLTVAAKLWLGTLSLPLFFQGLSASLNYAGSFLAMQCLGFTLATKQPSVTAAALAGSLKDGDAHGNVEPLVDQIARITRSQLAAIMGNLGAVTVGALLLHFVWLGANGRPLLDHAKATYIVKSLDPLHSGTVLFAMLTGFLLWLSSIAAGWLENWAVYCRMPEGIARHHGLVRFIGPERSRAVAQFFARNVSGFGGNVALGFLLGMVPVFAVFFGLPLDVRHVTLSTGSLVLAAGTLSKVWTHAGFWWAVGGIATIGLMNFGVSFALALTVAVRARRVPAGTLGRLLRALLSRLRRSPGEFVRPPKEPAAAPRLSVVKE